MFRPITILAALAVLGGPAWAGPSIGAKSNPGFVEPYTAAAACGRPAPRALPSRSNPTPDACAVYMNGVVDMIFTFNPGLLCVPNGMMTNASNAQAMRQYLAANPQTPRDSRMALRALQWAYPCQEPPSRLPGT